MSLALVRAPASSANLGPGFDVLALALDLWLEVEARPAPGFRIDWRGEGAGEVPLDETNLILRAAQEGWESRLPGIELRVRNAIPIGATGRASLNTDCASSGVLIARIGTSQPRLSANAARRSGSSIR